MPAPLPDEFVTGHIGRFFLLNKIVFSQRPMSELAKLAGAAPRQMNHLEVMAQLCKVTVEQYAYHHTLAPFYLAVHGNRAVSWINAPPSLRQLMISARKGTRQSVRYCPECAAEDQGFFGFSYWRRSHQLPCVTWCVKHCCALLLASADTPLHHLPEELVRNVKASFSATTSMVECPVARRYEIICAAFLQRNESISTRSMTHLLQSQAMRKQLRCRVGVINGQHLDDLALRETNNVWLGEYFPDVLTKGSSSSLCRTYSSLKAYATQYYALALALLFDDTDEAMFALNSSPWHESKSTVEIPSASKAMADFLAGIPLLKAIQQNKTRMEDFERLLHATLRNVQIPIPQN